MSATEEKQVESGFKMLLGRTPSKAEMMDLIHIKDSLGLRGDDPLWMILYAMQYYQTAYKRIPDEINQALARTDAILTQFDATRLPEGRFYRMLGRWGQARIVGWSFVALVIAVAAGVVAGRFSIESAARELGGLNGGGQILMSCFNGTGRIVKLPDGHTYCYPVSADGKALAYIIN